MRLKPLLSSSVSPVNAFGLSCTRLTEHSPTHPTNRLLHNSFPSCIELMHMLAEAHRGSLYASGSGFNLASCHTLEFRITQLMKCKHWTGRRLHGGMSRRPYTPVHMSMHALW